MEDGGSTALYAAYSVDAVYTVDTVDTVCNIQTALHCLNSILYILLGKVKTLLERADALLKRNVGLWTRWMSGWIPLRLL